MRAAALLPLAVACAADNWEEWQTKYGKLYAAAEEGRRRECFQRNLDNIAELNAKGSATFAAGPFADQCPEEFLESRAGKPRNTCTKSPLPDYTKPVDEKQDIDYRAKGAVTGIKDQGQEGTCWAFSATGNMEGQWFLKKGKLLEFSEQELVDCSPAAGNTDQAIDWVIKNGGINTEAAYPYKCCAAGQCDTSKRDTKVASFSSYVYVPPKNETKLLSALQNEGPISIMVAAAGFQHYKSGILDAKTCGGTEFGIDHAVLAVGYGFDGNQAYWIVKNSWGAKWGEDGYIRLAYGQNTCKMVSCMSVFGLIGDRYHCDTASKKCVLAAKGHSTMDKCTETCT